VDAKNQKTTYTYDSYKRVTEIKRYIWEQPFGFPLAYYERPDQATKFYYDSNPDGSFRATNRPGGWRMWRRSRSAVARLGMRRAAGRLGRR
jgi:hypothetical protein